jgi:hypothetical protein
MEVVTAFFLPLSATDKIDDFDLVAGVYDGLVKRCPFEDDEIMFDGNTAWVDFEPAEQLGHRERTIDVERIAVERNRHRV